MNRKKFYLIAFAIIALIIFLHQTKQQREFSTHIEGVMDTSIDLTLITEYDGKKIIEEISQMLELYDKKFSHTDSESEIYKLNNLENVSVSDETYEIIKNCEQFYKDTNGSFDITVGAVSNQWNQTFDDGVLPDITESLKSVGYDSIEFNDIEKTLKITLDSQNINLGAVVKGYAADKIKEYIDENNVENALINLGGNIYAKGKNRNAQLWNIGIMDPKNDSKVLLTLRVSDKFVITSGNYIRYRDINSVRYHHIIDAKSGYPVQNELNSVTIISEGGFLGDALSTSCFLLGFEDSKILLEKYGVLAVFTTKDNKIYYSGELEKLMQRISENYEYIPF